MKMTFDAESIKMLNEWIKMRDDTLLYMNSNYYPSNIPICLNCNKIKLLPKIKHGKLLPTRSLRIKIPKYYNLDNCYYEDGWPYIIAEDPTKTWCFLKNGEITRRGLPLNFPINKLTLIPLNQFERNITNEELIKYAFNRSREMDFSRK